MIKKLVLAVTAVFFLFSSLPAQESAPKVLLVLGKFSEASLVPGMRRAVQLKKAGIEVRIIFEREAVLSFIDLNGWLSKPDWHKKMENLTMERSASMMDAISMPPRLKLPDMDLKVSEAMKLWMGKIKEEKIPYTVCTASAKYFYGVYDELKAMGEPLSPDIVDPVDISPYLKQGYQVLTY